MDYYEAMASQPANLAASHATTAAALAALDLGRWRTGTLVASSMGASAHAGHSLVARLARHGRRAFVVDASTLMAMETPAVLGDSFLFVSEGGRSRETIEAARRVGPSARLGLTNVPEAPIRDAVDAVVGLGHGPDSKVYTVGYTATLQAFGLLATALDGVDEGDDWVALPTLLEKVRAELAAPAADFAGVLHDGIGEIDVVGTSSALSSVAETALLFRESTRLPTATYETYQYLHGPMEPLTPAHAVVLFGDDREVALAGYLADHGMQVGLVTAAADVPAHSGLHVLHIPSTAPMSRAIVEIAATQLVAGELARLRGLGIDGFLYHQDDTKVGPPLAGEGN